MTERSTQGDETDNFDKLYSQQDRLTVLLTGYEQLNEEIRYFGQRLHQMYYLLTSSTIVLIGLRAEEIVDWKFVFLLGGGVFLLSGYMMFRFRVKQRSGQVVRRHIEDKISQGNATDIYPLLRLQKDVWANITRWENFATRSLTQDITNLDEFTKISRPYLSAKYLSQAVFFSGLFFAVLGFILYLFQ